MPGTEKIKINALIAALALIVTWAFIPVTAGPDLSKLKTTPAKSPFPSLGDRLRSENAEGGWFKTHPVLSPQEIARLAQKSTAVLSMKAGQGTGFFVGKGVLVTNYHMVPAGISDGDQARMRGAEDFRTVDYKIKKLLSFDKEHDVALLEVEGAEKVPALLLASHSESQVGDEIYIYGNPRGFEGTFAVGRVSAFRLKAQVDHMAGGSVPGLAKGDYIQYTVPTSPGSSGSAVLNNRGEVIGLHCAGPPMPAGATGPDAKYELMNFAVTVRYIKDLLKQCGR
jgi:S1-C subfamily serine protease